MDASTNLTSVAVADCDLRRDLVLLGECCGFVVLFSFVKGLVAGPSWRLGRRVVAEIKERYSIVAGSN